jgi:hypothetical protein
MHRSIFLFIPLLCLVTLSINCPVVPSADAQTCGGAGVSVQVLGSGGPELQDKRASSSYLVWQDGQARVLVDAGGGSALRFGESGAQPHNVVGDPSGLRRYPGEIYMAQSVRNHPGQRVPGAWRV